MKRVHPNVWALGITSFITDVGSEMTAAVMPMYLAVRLGYSPSVIGLLDGLHFGATGITMLVGGVIADRFSAYRLTAFLGYAGSAVAKAVLFASSQISAISFSIGLDRLGKGVRTAPRDAIIGLSSDEKSLSASFGLHRTFDTAGSALGPFLAFAAFRFLHDAYRSVFLFAAIFTAAGAVVLAALVSKPRLVRPPIESAWTTLHWDRSFIPVIVSTSLLSLATISDGLLYLAAQQRHGLGSTAIVEMFMIAAIWYGLLAWPIGALADRIGRRSVLLLGYASYLAAYLVVLAVPRGSIVHIITPSLVGVYFASTEGGVAAIVSTTTRAEGRATILASSQAAIAGARFFASTCFGMLWASTSISFTIAAYAAALALTIGVGGWLLRIPAISASELESSNS